MIPNEIDEVKRLLFYQVENLSDEYEDLEEKYYHLNLNFKEKNRLLEFLIRDFKKLAEEMKYLNLHLENRRNQLKNKLNLPENKLVNGFTYNYETESCSGNSDSKEENDFSSLDRNELLANFQSQVNSYVQSLIDYKSAKLNKFKEEVLKIESNNNCSNLIKLVNSLNGDNLNDKIKNFVNYKRKLEDHLNKLTLQLKEEKEHNEKLNQKSPIDLSNLNKLNLEKLNLNRLEDNDEDKNFLEFKFVLLKVEENLNKLSRFQLSLQKENASYSNEKELIEGRIDNLKNAKRKLQRELRDANARIKELTAETKHNQKIIEQLKR